MSFKQGKKECILQGTKEQDMAVISLPKLYALLSKKQQIAFAHILMQFEKVGLAM